MDNLNNIFYIIYNVLIIIVVFKCLSITKKKEIDKSYKSTVCVLSILGILTFSISIIHFVSITLNGLNTFNSTLWIANLIYILVIVLLICLFIHSIYNIAKNIKNNKIFIKENINELDNISTLFIYTTLFTSVSGIFIKLINAFIQNEIIISFSMSYSFILYLILGIAFHIISILFRKGIETKEENKPTND